MKTKRILNWCDEPAHYNVGLFIDLMVPETPADLEILKRLLTELVNPKQYYGSSGIDCDVRCHEDGTATVTINHGEIVDHRKSQLAWSGHIGLCIVKSFDYYVDLKTTVEIVLIDATPQSAEDVSFKEFDPNKTRFTYVEIEREVIEPLRNAARAAADAATPQRL